MKKMIRFLGVVLIVLSVGCSGKDDNDEKSDKLDTWQPDVVCFNGVEYYTTTATLGNNGYGYLTPKFDAATKQVSLCSEVKKVFHVKQEGKEND